MVLEGAEETLASVQAVLTEVHVIELYDGAATEEEVNAFLEQRGFERVDSVYHELHDERTRFPAWGESLFMRRERASAGRR